MGMVAVIVVAIVMATAGCIINTMCYEAAESMWPKCPGTPTLRLGDSMLLVGCP